jgi:hypothetical protein
VPPGSTLSFGAFRYRWLASALAAVLAMLSLHVAFADATPVQLVLVYMPNISNTGTTAASGIAEIVMAEGEVRVKVTDLPRLNGLQHYTAWVINSQTNEFARLGSFNTAESTAATDFQAVLPEAIPDKHWNLLLITVEESAEADRPSGNHSIAAVFPGPDNAPLPVVLPNTGGNTGSDYLSVPDHPDWMPPIGFAAMTLGAGGGAGYRRGRGQG